MTSREELEKRYRKNIEAVLAGMHVPEPDTATIVKEVLLRSDAFNKARHPIIVVTGITHTGKSSLINALFDEKELTKNLLAVGLTSDTTDLIMKVQFQSGLVIYDTPGGGGNEWHENITRAYLGIPQLEEDAMGDSLAPITEIPIASADTYNIQTDSPKSIITKRQNDIDLIIFVVSVEAGLKRDDLRFFREVASIVNRESPVPVIVAINKIDLAKDQRKIKANQEQIYQRLNRKAIPISAVKGTGLDQLAVAIHHALPNELARVLGATVDSNHKKLVRTRQIEVDIVITAVKVAHLIDQSREQIDNTIEYMSNILGLYSLIVSQYIVSEKQLKASGVDLDQLWQNVRGKMDNIESTTNTAVISQGLVGLAFGALVASIATGGVAALPIAIGVVGGGSIGTAVGLANSALKKSETFKSALSTEFSGLERYIKSASRIETAASIMAFGRALRQYCEAIEMQKVSKTFSQLFDHEYPYAQEQLRPFATSLEELSDSNEKELVRKISAAILK